MMNATLVKVVRISVMSEVGTTHLMLVIGGCIFYRDLLAPSFPAAKHLGAVAGLVGFLSLLWPIYALMAVPRMVDALRVKVERRRSATESGNG
jgi:hypothetical protein